MSAIVKNPVKVESPKPQVEASQPLSEAVRRGEVTKRYQWREFAVFVRQWQKKFGVSPETAIADLSAALLSAAKAGTFKVEAPESKTARAAKKMSSPEALEVLGLK